MIDLYLVLYWYLLPISAVLLSLPVVTLRPGRTVAAPAVRRPLPAARHYSMPAARPVALPSSPPEVVARVFSSSTPTSRRSSAHVVAHAPGLVVVVVALVQRERANKFARGSQGSACCGTSPRFWLPLAQTELCSDRVVHPGSPQGGLAGSHAHAQEGPQNRPYWGPALSRWGPGILSTDSCCS